MAGYFNMRPAGASYLTFPYLTGYAAGTYLRELASVYNRIGYGAAADGVPDRMLYYRMCPTIRHVVALPLFQSTGIDPDTTDVFRLLKFILISSCG